MVNSSIKQKSSRCFQCGSQLIFVSEETVQPEGTRFQQTNTVYRCSNIECQKKKDKERKDRLNQLQKKVDTEKSRIENIQETRKVNQKSKIKAPITPRAK